MDQSDKFMKLYLTGLSGVQVLPVDAVKSEFTSTSVSVRVEGLNGKNHCFNIKETAEKILPDKSYIKVKTGNECHSFSACNTIVRVCISVQLAGPTVTQFSHNSLSQHSNKYF